MDALFLPRFKCAEQYYFREFDYDAMIIILLGFSSLPFYITHRIFISHSRFFLSCELNAVHEIILLY